MMQDTIYKMKQRVTETIRKYQMIDAGDHVLVGLSGGRDSVVLLDVLSGLRNLFEYQVSACHLNHQLRGDEAFRDEAFVQKICSEREIPLYSDRKDVLSYKKEYRVSLEEAARTVRYRFYREAAASIGCSKLATGHHADDNAESVLIFLLRGSGSAGLSGIPPVRDDFYIRPLIELQRSDIQGYMKERGLLHVEDSSNYDTAILRNRIRKHLLPVLKNEYNPAIVDVLNRLSHVSSSENTLLDELASELFSELVVTKEDHFFLNKKTFNAQKVALKRRLIRLILRKTCGNLRKIGLIHAVSIIVYMLFPIL